MSKKVPDKRPAPTPVKPVRPAPMPVRKRPGQPVEGGHQVPPPPPDKKK